MLNEKIINMSLSSLEVEKQIKLCNSNFETHSKTKSLKRIILDNTITLFNFINVFLFLVLLLIGSYKNTLFIGVVFLNTIIGIIQEIRSKICVDRLSIVVASKIDVVRNGTLTKVESNNIVLGDVIKLTSGCQIPVDCQVIDGVCFVNESLLTGESDLIKKNENDLLMSGSFVSSGQVFAKVKCIGDNCYAAKLQKEATYNKKIDSEIMNSLNKLLLFVSIIMVPVGTLLFCSKIFINKLDFVDTVSGTIGAIIGMIPSGLVLLTSSVLAVSVVRLARKKVLVQQLFCIESLARVDVLCLDKTGTITTGDMQVVSVEYLISDKNYVDIALKSLSHNSVDMNATILAIDNYINCELLKPTLMVPFSSEKKWSGGNFNDKSFVLGAAEFIFKGKESLNLQQHINKFEQGVRCVVLAQSNDLIVNNNLPRNLKPLALVFIKDDIRCNAKETIDYFKQQGVTLKVISGDNHKTVERIACSVGIPDANKSIDVSTLKSDEELKNAVEEYAVFGRVTPEQKRKIILLLKEIGHTVAMTGDGVNDVLALKEADCSVALASGSDATKNISQIVLVNDDFSSMPEVVAEGRRSVNNIQRSGALFLVKTLYSTILSIAYIFVTAQYPFEPIHLTLISAFTIGIPSFVLALEPNHNIIKGKFLKNIIFNALPSAITIILNVIFLGILSRYYNGDELSTIACILTTVIGFMLVVRLSLPLNLLRLILLIVIVGGFILTVLLLGDIIGLVPLSAFGFGTLIVHLTISLILFNILFTFLHNIIEKE